MCQHLQRKILSFCFLLSMRRCSLLVLYDLILLSWLQVIDAMFMISPISLRLVYLSSEEPRSELLAKAINSRQKSETIFIARRLRWNFDCSFVL